MNKMWPINQPTKLLVSCYKHFIDALNLKHINVKHHKFLLCKATAIKLIDESKALSANAAFIEGNGL